MYSIYDFIVINKDYIRRNKMTKKKDYKVKRIKRDLVYTGSILDIYADTMELENGKDHSFLA